MPSAISISTPRCAACRFSGRFLPRLPRRAPPRTIECDAVVYLSSFENHPNAVSELAAGRALWGNSPAVLRRVRDPNLLAEALRRRGLSALDVSDAAAPALHPASRFSRTSVSDARRPSHDFDRSWLVKPLASGGGHGVRRWQVGAPNPARLLPAGVCGGNAWIGRVRRGRRARGATRCVSPAGRRTVLRSIGYGYLREHSRGCGRQQFARDEALVDAACALTRVVTEEFGLVGVNGIDFVARDGVPYALEVNPRWSASLELVERAYGFSVFGAHAEACASNDAAPVRSQTGATRLRCRRQGRGLRAARRRGRRHTSVAGRRLCRRRSERPRHFAPGRTNPRRPTGLHRICGGADSVACHAALVQRADRVYAELAAWEGGAA